MRKCFLSLSFFVFHFSLVFSQTYGSCDRAATVKSSSFGPVTPAPATDQLCSERNSGGKYFDAEHNVAWFTFVVPEDTTLTFDLTPANTNDDLDFLLFKDEEGGEFCSHLGIINNNDPVRTNLSKASSAKGSTGLSRKGTETIVAKNGASTYSKALKVKKGERYYLVVDNRNSTGAFTLTLHLDFNPGVKVVKQGPSYIDANPIKAPRIQAPAKDNAPPVSPPVQQKNDGFAPVKAAKTMLIVKVMDSLGNAIKAELDMEGIMANQTMTMITAQDSFALDPLQTVSINCNAVGYVFTQASYIAPDTATRAYITFTLSQIRKGQSIVLKGIQFEEGNAKLLPSSNEPLMNVVEFLRNNREVKIMIKGYVNDPFGGNSGPAKKLSKERAEAVRDFLRDQGVSVNRMDYKGYGNQDMLYPNPINKEQEQANRRVEVEIR